MRLTSPQFRLVYGPRALSSPAQREGLQGANAHVMDALRTAGHHALGTLPPWPIGASEPGERANGPAGIGI